ncbi:1-(5-phosphoribosyl)-5-[(5-phosphoribosylamino)methylideneamino]imidazole-4-carboxamide isomerase [Loigolactobacillus coryniformis]|uniref:1-(5-phosphoribosyl)-5-[(5-phosphoribosylamino)methylideneamino] imidazole-4-carboxamide isomerase n=1 Tax=Loigolactobacillus coryniformis subsp. coryniformis CECT 5711 TaxID=1185325 RepID=J3JBV3_9LACO|nr:1-(5-phosphoribosyl)-5-[(5-phosphoribosylamino)methylideneamino]imidazole-4-carboxamide isomerase [Loigolactobacillus coryniformis]EJN56047.1 Phosphoribosylformimino-5-aminoimidazole carboxamide ribotide isomerase [Loigolactobacillus coryniformis subsp. coryniformis CECT 5711]
MKLYPAIDLKNGRSVRLYQGQFDQETVVNNSPLQQAKQIAAAGLTNLHLVDLDGAKDGRPVNQAIIAAIVEQTPLQVEIGGGIRTLAQIETYLNLGVTRVIIGSAALTDPELVTTAVKKFGAAKIVVGIDGKQGKVATEGWLAQSQVTMADLVAAMQKVGVQTFIVTDIERDGTLQGPNQAQLVELAAQFPAATFVASGGVRDARDLKDLAAAGIEHAIVGKALYAGSVTLAELAELSRNKSEL